MSIQRTTHFHWVDIIKGAAIIGVVLSHIEHPFKNYSLAPVVNLIYGLWFVSVFFVVGGFFLNSEKLSSPVGFIKGKMNTLYRLLLYFYIPAVLLHNVMLDIGFYDTVTNYGGKYMDYWGIGQFVKELALIFFFAGREPILGAMWFVYVLLLALIGLSIVSWILNRWITDRQKLEIVRAFVLFMGCVISCQMTNILDLTIPRFNNTITAMWLIYCGYLMMNILKLKFNNNWVAIFCGLIVYHIAVTEGGIMLNLNKYSDVLSLTISSISALYVIAYLSKKIENRAVGKALAWCGKESFYIMALHFVGFKFCTLILNTFGCKLQLSSLLAPADKNIGFTVLYLCFGVVFPLMFILGFRWVKKNFSVLCSRLGVIWN